MGNITWRSQASSEDTDSSLQGDLDEDTGKDTLSVRSRLFSWSSVDCDIGTIFE